MDTSTEVAKIETMNAYDQKASTEAMPIDKEHPIRFLSRHWKQNLTQEQWNKVLPSIVAMLEECTLYEYNVGPDELLKTTDMAIESLDHQADMSREDRMNPNLPDKDKKHILALEWAIYNLVQNNVLEYRIKKIVGAALTCLIGRSNWSRVSEEGIGFSLINFPKDEGNKILTQSLKAYRVLDDLHRWDINGFMEWDDDLYKMAEGRNYLACFSMIDMQVGPWIKRAESHLQDLGLGGVEGILLGEADILSRSSFDKPMTSTDEDEVMLGGFIGAIRRKFPLAINNDDDEYRDVGFCSASGKVLAKLAPLMFLYSQFDKKGCQWQLIGSEYHAVGLTVGTAFVAPLSMARGLDVLKAFDKCPQDVFPSQLSDEQHIEMARWTTSKRRKIRDDYYLPSIDDDEEDAELKRKASQC